jgi:hypothetical protein
VLGHFKGMSAMQQGRPLAGGGASVEIRSRCKTVLQGRATTRERETLPQEILHHVQILHHVPGVFVVPAGRFICKRSVCPSGIPVSQEIPPLANRVATFPEK